MKYAKIIILILATVKKSGQTLLVPEKEIKPPISECIIHILNKYFVNSIKISIISFNQESSITSEMIKKIDLPVLINAREMPESEVIDKRISNDVSVVVDDESSNILKVLNDTKWNPTTKFLVITTKSQTSEEHMINIFQQFWSNNIVNVLLLSFDNDDVRIYTFIPFNPHDCAIHKPVLLATWKSGQITTEEEIIQKERVTDLNGCTLNGTVINLPPTILFPNGDSITGAKFVSGMEGSILMEISKQLNFKWNLAEPKDGKAWGSLQPYPHGAVGEVFLKKSHFACGRFSDTSERYKYLDMSVPVSCKRECVSWAVPAGAKKSQPAWIRLLINGFTHNVWYLVLITIVSLTAALRILSKASTADKYLFKGNVKTIIYTFGSSLGSSVKSPKSSFLRIAFLSWLMYSFVILTAYQALMGSKLTVPHRQSDINTFKDLLESDLRITGILSVFKILTHGREGQEIEAIGKRFKDYPFNFKNAHTIFKEAIKNITLDRNEAHMWTSTILIYNLMSHPEAKGLVHFMKQCLYQYYSVVLLQKNCPFTSKVNRIIRALSEAGIICKWRRQYLYDIPHLEPTVQKLSLHRMIGSFVILGAGLGVALIIFVVELAIFWYLSKRKTLKIVVARRS